MPITPGSNVGAEQLNQYIERIERLEEEKKGLMADIKDVYAEAKGTGFDPKIMKIIIKMRAMNRDHLHEMDELTETYRKAVGLSNSATSDFSIRTPDLEYETSGTGDDTPEPDGEPQEPNDEARDPDDAGQEPDRETQEPSDEAHDPDDAGRDTDDAGRDPSDSTS